MPHPVCHGAQAQKLAAAAATAERRAAKLQRHNATLTKLLAREHGQCRVAAQSQRLCALKPHSGSYW